MKLDTVIAKRPNKTIYRDGDTCIKVFGTDFSKIDVLNEALNQARIEETELQHQREQESINNQIYQVSVKENAIEMEVKRLDTMVTTLQQQLKAVEEAEGSAIERATPKFAGVG